MARLPEQLTKEGRKESVVRGKDSKIGLPNDLVLIYGNIIIDGVMVPYPPTTYGWQLYSRRPKMPSDTYKQYKAIHSVAQEMEDG